jgi:hypothetical protein
MIEAWHDPATGRQVSRQLVGTCAYGQLAVKPNKRTSEVDLFWRSINVAVPRFDLPLEELIAACWRDLARALGCRLPDPQLVRIKALPGAYWVCRLPPKQYHVEPRQTHGSSLFEIIRPRMIRLAPIPAPPPQPPAGLALPPAASP